MARTSRAVAAGLALAFLALHLPYTARSLEDIDSINFALGIRDFDVAEHQPHPPGYPVLILIAKIVNAAAGSEVLTLSLLGIVSGALLAFALVALFRALDGAARRAGDPKRVALQPDPERVGLQPWTAVAAAALALTAPLMWITAARPLSDVPGLAAALFVQWLLVRAGSTRAIAFAALAAGLAAGIRSQVVWLTVPLLLLVVARNRGAWRLDAALSIAGAYVAGVLTWAAPLLALSGGPSGYWNAVAFQGGADLSGVTMLWTNPTPRQVLATVEYHLLHPWGWWPLAAAVLMCAAWGGIRLLVNAPRAGLTLATMFGPYAIFDMLFQETVTTRYALPLIVPVAFLAASGLRAAAPRWGAWAAAGVAAMALAVGHPTLVSYASGNAPAFRMLADMRAQTATSPGAPVLAVHRRQDFDSQAPPEMGGARGARVRRAARSTAAARVARTRQVLEQRREGNGVVRQRPAAERSRAHSPWRAAGDVPMAAPLPRAHRWRSAGRNGLVCDRSACLVSRRGLVADPGSRRCCSRHQQRTGFRWEPGMDSAGHQGPSLS